MHFEFNNSSSVALQVVNLKTCLKQMKMDSDVPTNNNDMLVTLFFFGVNLFCQNFAYVPLLLKFPLTLFTGFIFALTFKQAIFFLTFAIALKSELFTMFD